MYGDIPTAASVIEYRVCSMKIHIETCMHACMYIYGDIPTAVSVMEYRVCNVEIHSGESRSVMVCLG